MILRLILISVTWVALVGSAKAQAIPCNDIDIPCAHETPNPDLNFDFKIEVKKVPQHPRKMSKAAPPKIVRKRIVKKWRSPPRSLNNPRVVSVTQLPQAPIVDASWVGLLEIPAVKLVANDVADITGQYIVDLDVQAFAAAGLDLKTIRFSDLAELLGVQASQIRSVQRRFLFSVVIKASAEQAAALAKNSFVKTVHPDTKIKAAGESLKLSWGLDRLDSPALPLDHHFDRDFGDYQTRVYLFDTGVDDQHGEFGNRVKFGANFVQAQNETALKCREHGTEMASLIVGQNTGAAPKAEIVQLVVLPCLRQQTGEASSLVEAAEWLLIREADFGDGKPAIANMSLAGKWSRKINDTVKVLTENQVAVVVAAGNNSQDACRFSPASAKDAITVAATGPYDETPSFSNFGTCVDINAPGRLLTVLTEGKSELYVASNGTSGAAALVSGLLARSLKAKGPKAADVWLANAAVPAKLWRKDQPNMLLAQVNPVLSDFCRIASGKRVVKLFKGPMKSSKQVRSLADGSIVKLDKLDMEWAHIVAPGGDTGWILVKGALLQLDEDVPCKALH